MVKEKIQDKEGQLYFGTKESGFRGNPQGVTRPDQERVLPTH